MKAKNKFWISMVLMGLVFSFSGCSESTAQKDKDVESLKEFVTDLKDKTENKLESGWESVDDEFEEKVEKIDGKKDDLSDDVKAEVKQLKADFAEMKESYQAKFKEQKMAMEVKLVKNLYDVMLTDDSNFDLMLVTEDNITPIYKSFVDELDNNKDDYTKEEWDEVNVLWDALNERKDKLEDQLPAAEKLEIAKLQARYVAFKALYK